MRTESRFLLGAGAFAVTVGVVYWFISYEDAGFVLLTLMGFASALIGGYMLFRAHAHRRPEDDPDADYAESAGEEVGRFSSGSIWPLVMGLGTVLALRRKIPAGDDPWGGYTLEWATTSPPPEHNFHWLPPIRSERPVFDWRHREHPAVEPKA